MSMLRPPFPFPVFWNNVHEQQLSSGQQHWLVPSPLYQYTSPLAAPALRLPYYICLHTPFTGKESNSLKDIYEYVEGGDYEEVIEMNPLWAARLRNTLKRIRPHQSKASMKRLKKLQNKKKNARKAKQLAAEKV